MLILHLALQELNISFIQTVDDFKNMSSNTNPTMVFYMLNDIDFVNLSDYIPFEFTGTLNGNGFAVKNLKVSNYHPNSPATPGADFNYTLVYQEHRTETIEEENLVKKLYPTNDSIPSMVTYSTHHQNVGIFTKVSDNTTIRGVTFSNISIVCIIPGPEYF